MEKRCCGCMRLKTQSPICEHCGYNEDIDNLPHQLPVNTVLIDRYRIGKVLGQGGFGITYIGWDEKRGATVAIKEYYPTGVVAPRDVSGSHAVLCKDPAGKAFFANNRELFLNEARALLKFGNVPQIVHVQNIFEMNNTVYIAMEYVQGVDLRKHMRMNGLMTPEETFRILQPVIRALAKVHEAGLVHRDISPDNIMLLPDGSPKLLDFGAADQFTGKEEQESKKATEAILKHGFAPPEQYKRDGKLGPWTDVYALCATIHYCLTGRIPPAVHKRRDEGAVIDWYKIPGLTEEQIDALDKGMEMRLEDRYPDMDALYIGLFGELPEEIPESRSEPVTRPQPESVAAEKTPRKPVPLALKLGIAAAVLAVAAGIGIWKVQSVPKGWITEGETRCYYVEGEKVTGIQQIEGVTYYFDESGVLRTGWQTVGGETYYFAEDGAMISGTVTIDGAKYEFREDGAFLSRTRVLTAQQLQSSRSDDKASYTGTKGKTLKSEYQILSNPVRNCTGLTVQLQLTDYMHGNVDQWCFYYRDLAGQWQKVEPVFSLTNDQAVQTYTFPEPISFDACACFCLSLGSLWNFESSCTLTSAEILEYEIG